MQAVLAILSLILSVVLADSDNHANDFTALHTGELNNKFQGDIVLTINQAAELIAGESKVNENYKWPNKTVYYELSPFFKDHPGKGRLIELALRAITKKSCVKFIRRDNQKNFVSVTAYEGGCYSNVGYLNSGRQELNLDPRGDCFRLGTVIHEFLHTLGFFHMHSSSDRHKYVKVIEASMRDKIELHFRRISRLTNFDVEYDVLSIMHFGPYCGTKDGSPTIMPNDISLLADMGQRIELTKKDIERLNRMYECNDV